MFPKAGGTGNKGDRQEEHVEKYQRYQQQMESRLEEHLAYQLRMRQSIGTSLVKSRGTP